MSCDRRMERGFPGLNNVIVAPTLSRQSIEGGTPKKCDPGLTKEEANTGSVVDGADDEESAKPQSCHVTVLSGRKILQRYQPAVHDAPIGIMRDNSLRCRASELNCRAAH